MKRLSLGFLSLHVRDTRYSWGYKVGSVTLIHEEPSNSSRFRQAKRQATGSEPVSFPIHSYRISFAILRDRARFAFSSAELAPVYRTSRFLRNRIKRNLEGKKKEEFRRETIWISDLRQTCARTTRNSRRSRKRSAIMANILFLFLLLSV